MAKDSDQRCRRANGPHRDTMSHARMLSRTVASAVALAIMLPISAMPAQAAAEDSSITSLELGATQAESHPVLQDSENPELEPTEDLAPDPVPEAQNSSELAGLTIESALAAANAAAERPVVEIEIATENAVEKLNSIAEEIAEAVEAMKVEDERLESARHPREASRHSPAGRP